MKFPIEIVLLSGILFSFVYGTPHHAMVTKSELIYGYHRTTLRLYCSQHMLCLYEPLQRWKLGSSTSASRVRLPFVSIGRKQLIYLQKSAAIVSSLDVTCVIGCMSVPVQSLAITLVYDTRQYNILVHHSNVADGTSLVELTFAKKSGLWFLNEHVGYDRWYG
jgi:hypothetical protein